MKNAFYFILKALFLLRIFKVFVLTFGHAENQLDEKDKVEFKIYDVTYNYNTHIAQYPTN